VKTELQLIAAAALVTLVACGHSQTYPSTRAAFAATVDPDLTPALLAREPGAHVRQTIAMRCYVARKVSATEYRADCVPHGSSLDPLSYGTQLDLNGAAASNLLVGEMADNLFGVVQAPMALAGGPTMLPVVMVWFT